MEQNGEALRIPLRGLGILALAGHMFMGLITFHTEPNTYRKDISLDSPRLSDRHSLHRSINQPEAPDTHHATIALVCEQSVFLSIFLDCHLFPLKG